MRRYVYDLLRRLRPGGAGYEDAADVVQAYLARSMETGGLSGDGTEIRVFRAYLQDQLRKFTFSWLRKERAAKRGAGRVKQVDSLEDISPADERMADVQLERGWIGIALDRAIIELGRRNPRDRIVILDLIRGDNEGRESHDLGAILEVRPEAIASVKHRAKRRLSILLASELRQTVADDEAFEEEYDTLLRYVPWLRDSV